MFYVAYCHKSRRHFPTKNPRYTDRLEDYSTVWELGPYSDFNKIMVVCCDLDELELKEELKSKAA